MYGVVQRRTRATMHQLLYNNGRIRHISFVVTKLI